MYSLLAFSPVHDAAGNLLVRRARIEGARRLAKALEDETDGTPAERVGRALGSFMREGGRLRFNLTSNDGGAIAEVTQIGSIAPGASFVPCYWRLDTATDASHRPRNGTLNIFVRSDESGDDGKILNMNVTFSGGMYDRKYLNDVFRDIRSIARIKAEPGDEEDLPDPDAPDDDKSAPVSEQTKKLRRDIAARVLLTAITFRRCL
jgi:hypothetical protein